MFFRSSLQKLQMRLSSSFTGQEARTSAPAGMQIRSLLPELSLSVQTPYHETMSKRRRLYDSRMHLLPQPDRVQVQSMHQSSLHLQTQRRPKSSYDARKCLESRRSAATHQSAEVRCRQRRDCSGRSHHSWSSSSYGNGRKSCRLIHSLTSTFSHFLFLSLDHSNRSDRLALGRCHEYGLWRLAFCFIWDIKRTWSSGYKMGFVISGYKMVSGYKTGSCGSADWIEVRLLSCI